MDEHARPVLFDLFHRTRLETIRARYLKLEPDPDGRVRPVVKMSHVKTLRLAYAEPALQQFPEEARHLFVAAPGHVLLSVDYAQLEARLLAYFSGDPGMIAAFEAGLDIHAENSKELFNLTNEQWSALPDKEPYRIYSKSGFLYKLVYGGTAASGDKKLFCPCPPCAAHKPKMVALSRDESVAAERRWLARHPRVLEYQEEVARFVRRTHYYEPLLGGRRYVSKPWGADLARELKNIPNQTGGAHLMYRAQGSLEARHQAPIILQHHDSFLLEVPEDERDLWYTRTREAMEEPVVVGGREVVFPVDGKWGRNWGRKSDENPEGLRAL
jgi:DNA polymerase-1